jgi:predicted nucleotidyltransferase
MKKQVVSFMALFGLVLVLSVYYVLLPNNLFVGQFKPSLDNTLNVGVTIDEASDLYFTKLNSMLDEKHHSIIYGYEEVVASDLKSNEEKEVALNMLINQQKIQNSEATLVSMIKDLGYFNSQFVVLGLQGSQNYGLSDEYSDVDTKLLLLPSFENLVYNKEAKSTTHVLSNKEHMDLKDLRLFLPTVLKQNVNFVELLFTDYYYVNNMYEEEWNKLLNAKEEVARYNPARTVQAMVGIAKNKYSVFTNKKSEGFRSDLGYDPKQVYQMGRVVEFLERYMEGKDSYAELLKSKQRDKLLSFKRGKLSLSEAEEYMNQEVVRVNALTDEYLKLNHKVNPEVETLLKEVQYNVMKTYMKECVKYV